MAKTFLTGVDRTHLKKLMRGVAVCRLLYRQQLL
jgi:hypothetical protein